MILDLGSINTSATPTNDRIERQAKAKTFTDDTRCTFGKHKGQPLRDVPDGYLRWLWENGKSSEEGPLTDYIAKRLRIKPKTFKDPMPRQYFAVLEHEPLHPDWEAIFQFQDNTDISF